MRRFREWEDVVCWAKLRSRQNADQPDLMGNGYNNNRRRK